MARFSYSALTSSGETISGNTNAATEAAVVDWLLGQGHTPLQIDLMPEGGTPAGLGGLFRQSDISTTELTAITRDLSNLIGSGLTLERALRIISSNSDRKGVRTSIERMLDLLRNGTSFARALEKTSSDFPRYYTSLVSAAEASGTLSEVLERLSLHLKKTEAIRTRITSALIYPIFLLIMISVTMVLVVGYVLPQFKEVFDDAGSQLPLVTQLVMGVGTFFEKWGWLVLLSLAVFAVVAIRSFSHPPTRKLVDRAILGKKAFFGLALKTESAAFARTVGMLLQNGLPLHVALQRSSETAGNLVVRNACLDMREQVREGSRFLNALRKTNVFPDLLIQMTAVGEETGRLDEMLLQVADIYEREVENTVERLLTLLVPVLTIGMGIVVGGLIVAVLVGILSINQLAL